MKKNRLKEIVAELQGASKMHLKQSKEIQKHIDDMKSPANFNQDVSGENLGNIQKDKKGNEYALVDNETDDGLKSGDTIRPADGIEFSKGIINKSQGKISKEGKSFLMDGDYKTIGIGNKSFKLKKL
jgi:hypothetical protein|tara:strand:- start:61 stop:441 length:381 start_codon:yes stop_codon:yes gene_type:complete